MHVVICVVLCVVVCKFFVNRMSGPGRPSGSFKVNSAKERKRIEEEEKLNPDLRDQRAAKKRTFFHSLSSSSGAAGSEPPITHPTTSASASHPNLPSTNLPPTNAPKLPKRDERVDDCVYFDPSKGREGKWSKGNKCLMCLCDGTVCKGGLQLTRCKNNSLNAEVEETETRSTRGSAEVPVTNSLGPLRVEVLRRCKLHISANDIKIYDDGAWDPKVMKGKPGFVCTFRNDSNLMPFPLRVGSFWTKDVTGRHAMVLNKPSATIAFKITVNPGKPAVPLFVACDHDEFFSTKIYADNPNELEQKWLSRSGTNTHETVRGKDFMGFSNPDFGNYFRQITSPEFSDAAPTTRKTRVRMILDQGQRQSRRLRKQFFGSFDECMKKLLPTNPAGAFQLLREHSQFYSQYDSTRVNSSTNQLITGAALDNMVTAYANENDKSFKIRILAMYSPFHSYENTISTFPGVNRHLCKQANVYNKLTSGKLRIKKEQHSIMRMSKETVDHAERFALSAENTLRVAHSDSSGMRFLRLANRLRMFRNYKAQCKRNGGRAMGRSRFYEYFSEKIFKDAKATTCACVSCVENGDMSFDDLISMLRSTAFSDDVRSRLLDGAKRLQNFFKFTFKGLLQSTSTDSRTCVQYALSIPGDPELCTTCDHTHTDSTPAMHFEPAFMEEVTKSLREVTEWSEGTSQKDSLRMLENIKDNIFR